MKIPAISQVRAFACTALLATSSSSWSSSHREAPLITQTPKIDATDFYMFNSYEAGRSNYVTFIANYVPLQDAYGGPNYFTLDPDALYEIHIDNNGDAIEDLTFQFKFDNQYMNFSLPIGPAENQRTNAVPLINIGQIGSNNVAALNLLEVYTLNLIQGPRRTGTAAALTPTNGSPTFQKPVDNIGNKSIPDYESYANSYLYDINVPGCELPGRVFVGQRKDPFVVNLGETFDLVNITTSPLGPVDANKDSLYYKNVTSLILEVPKQCLISGTNTIIGAWTTASKITRNGDGSSQTNQVSRLSMPLVNEVVIGLKDKDKFNASEPKDDPQFLDYVTHPTLPALVEVLFGPAGVRAPTAFPRNDLVAVFLTGVEGLNKNGSVGEMMRLNTATATLTPAEQKNLGVLAGDKAGYPNGRRPGDDVVDISLRAAMGVLLSTNDAPSGPLPFTDGAYIDGRMFRDRFPYLNAPLPGSPNEPSVNVTLQSAVTVQGPYQSVPVTYDAGARKLSGPKADPNNSFYRLKADGKVNLDGIAVEGDKVTLGVR